MITSSASPHIKFVRSLHENRGRKLEGAFLVEGVRLVEEAIASGQPLRACYVQPETLSATSRGEALLQSVRRSTLPVHEVNAAVMRAASDTVTPQGIVAVLSLPGTVTMPADPQLILVLDGIQDPGNLGTILRSAAAAGASAVITTPGTADVYAPKTVRAAMGAHFRLPILTAVEWSAAASLLAGRQILLAEAAGGVAYDQVDWLAPAALIIGGEPHGPSPTGRELATGKVSIPMASGVESLNAAVAASVLLFEAQRQRLRHGDRGRDAR